jgi:uncharacterized DUF497 family protein
MTAMADLAYDFTWDAHKATSNLEKHGVAFEQAASIFLDVLALTVFDAAHSQYEERWFTLGHTAGGMLLAVSHTYQETSSSSAQVRIISARPATKQERRFYADEPR